MVGENKFNRESEMRVPVVAWLSSMGFLSAVEFHVLHMADIVAGRFGDRPSPGRRPPLIKVVAVELKLRDIAGVIHQAKSNRGQMNRSYAAMPEVACRRMRPKTLDKFRQAGVGLLCVGDEVRMLIASSRGNGPTRRIEENLWRRVRGVYGK